MWTQTSRSFASWPAPISAESHHSTLSERCQSIPSHRKHPTPSELALVTSKHDPDPGRGKLPVAAAAPTNRKPRVAGPQLRAGQNLSSYRSLERGVCEESMDKDDSNLLFSLLADSALFRLSTAYCEGTASPNFQVPHICAFCCITIDLGSFHQYPQRSLHICNVCVC